jgi:predicted transposase YdaD
MPYVTTWERRAEMKGRELGREEGAQDRNIEIARRMIVESISLDIICRTTGLSRSEVESLQAEEPVH